MIKRKMAPSGDGGGSQSQAKNKRQKLAAGCKSQKQQATGARRQQNQSSASNQNQTEEPVWIYGLINNIEQMLSHLNAANNNQRLKEAVQQQQLMGAGAQTGASNRQAANGAKSAKQASRSRPSNNSSGYSTPSSLYSTASLSPPFSSSSLAHCAYSSSSSSNSPISAPGAAQSPRQQQQSTATTTTATTNQKTPATNNKTSQQKQQQQQQILPRSPLSRQIKFHEYKGPPQARRPNNQQKQAQAGSMPSAGQDSKGFIQVEPIEQQQRPQPIDCAEFAVRQSSLQTSQQIRLNPMATTATCNQQANSLQTQVAVLAPMTTGHQQQQQQCKPTPNGPANQASAGYQMGPGDNCGHMMIVSQQPVQQINQTTNYMVQANAPSQPQRQHVSLQLIRGSDGQQQQLIVLDAVAFQQMQQQQQQQRSFDQKQQQNSIILLQQEPMRQPDRGYNAPLAAAVANSGDDNSFQMHQAQLNAFMVETSNCLTAASGEGQFQDDFLNELEEEIANEEVYYRAQTHQHHHHQQPVRATALRHQAHGHQLHFDAGQCQRGPISEGTSQTMSNYLNSSNQFEQAPLQQPQLVGNQQAQFYANQEQLYTGANCNSLGGVQLDCDAPDDTSEIEPTISFDGDLDHGMMYSEFIDSQDIPLNVDESDWLKKFLPPCTSS